MLAVLGFHRSLTSVVAQWLHKSGLCMGEYLMPPAPSNPEGHYEDMPLVALHDNLLAEQGTNWQFHGEVGLSQEAGLAVIERYVSLRNHLHGENWGYKDPRQCLFLPNWQQVLGERGRYLVVLRHWSASIQSLLKRSSRDLAFGLGSPTTDGAFWREPGHAARVWLAYNQRLLAFLETCPSRQRLVLTQQALMQGVALPSLVNEQFSLSLDTSTPSPIKHSLVHDEVEASLRSHLTDKQMDDMNAVWERLLSFAQHRVEREEPHWKPDSYTFQDRWLSHSILSASPFEQEAQPQPRSSHSNDRPAPENSFVALSMRAQEEYQSLNLAQAEKHTREAIAQKPDDIWATVRLTCIFLVSGKLEDAESLLSSALERQGDVPILLHYQATVLDLLGRTQEAVAILADVEDRPEFLERHRIAYLLKSDVQAGRDRFNVWAKHRSSSLEAWQKVSQSLKGIESQPLREGLALRVARIWNHHA